ncbi:MAG: hypothetical protein ACE15F_23495 [bacterium]
MMALDVITPGEVETALFKDFVIRSSRLAGFRRLFKPWMIIVKETGIWVYTKARVDCECHLTRCVHNRYPIIQQIKWDQITGVRSSDGFLWSSVTIDTFDGSEYCVNGLWKPDAERFIREATNYLSDLSKNSTQQLETYLQNKNHPSEPLDCCELRERHPTDVKIVYKKSN